MEHPEEEIVFETLIFLSNSLFTLYEMISGRKAEELAKRELEKEFGQRFFRGRIRVGSRNWEFDLISEDRKIVAQVKSCRKRYSELTPPQLETRFKRDYAFDCVLLEKVKAERKIFYLFADKDLFEEFCEWIKGLFPEVELRFHNAWEASVMVLDKTPETQITHLPSG